MFQTFTGNSKRPRQVNLSGRNQNPFAKYGQGPSDTVSHAQQTRLERELGRARTYAAINLQKTWRGIRERSQLRQTQRAAWDKIEDNECVDEDTPLPYPSQGHAYQQLTRLLLFIDVRDEQDRRRLRKTFCRLLESREGVQYETSNGPWPLAYLRLQKTCLAGIQANENSTSSKLFVQILDYTGQIVPELTTRNVAPYYDAIRNTLLRNTVDIPASVLLAPLRWFGQWSEQAHQMLAIKILPIPNLSEKVKSSRSGLSGLEEVTEHLNYKLLIASLSNILNKNGEDVAQVLRLGPSRPRHHLPPSELSKQSAWLSAHLIYLSHRALGFEHPEKLASTATFTFVICRFLSYIADNLPHENAPLDMDVVNTSLLSRCGYDPFIINQVDVLVSQEAIASLIYQMNLGAGWEMNVEQPSEELTDRTRALATYILTLLRLYPNRSDDIRMWLYIGGSATFENMQSAGGATAVKFFWRASRATSVFQQIHDDPAKVISCLRPPPNFAVKAVEYEWQIILLFIEMYSFVLKVMDDEEFFSYDDDPLSYASEGRKNSLRSDEIKTLSIFLKYLGFSMYYGAAAISRPADQDMPQRPTLSDGFPGQPAMKHTTHTRPLATINGVNIEYLKSAVTSLLRSIYERDSRRPFMPKGHWLMNLRFDSKSFIDAVVEEQERRHQAQDGDDEGGEGSDNEDWDITHPPELVGTGHARQLQRIQESRRQQAKKSRQHLLQAMAPRLEILQNIPFLIPFSTRVQIFRRFIHDDQKKRRDGVTNSEASRLTQMHAFPGLSLERHHARVRRGQEFEDAYDQFYGLGASLKEPIHITFLDQFDQEEAGIDGGGVTKEFLTSVTNQAFSENEGVKLFTENENHLWFPNPSALSEQRELLKDAGMKEGTPAFRSSMSDVLQRYEFLGRIVGKCLYEGILIDIGFAGFFLLKWALTGGPGSAPMETGYRPTINDLREFDEQLYQGLLKLKNYPGKVEDFALNFTVADTLSIPSEVDGVRTKVITKDLRPGGSNMSVTNENRLVYISYMTLHRLSFQPYHQTNAFLKGLGSMISPSWLSMFNQQELQTLVGGAASAINVSDLRTNTIYGGVYTIGDDGLEHESIQIFWTVMENLEDEDRRKVLKFVTSTPRAPLLGFSTLMPKFSIRDSGSDTTRLPSTSTCVNLLKLPRYKDFGTCQAKLLQAVNAGAGFDLS